MHFPTLPNHTGTGSNVPLVSIILPVRNQARTVSDCVRSLVGLEYPDKEIIVVDGGSTDGTRELVQKFSHEITLVDEEPLPVGWVGKNWACHLGYKRSRGELLLFTDGDSVHAIDSLARSVNYLRAENADLVTLAPGAILRSFWERLLQPPIFLLIMILVGGKLVNDDNRLNAIGNGQYMLFRREAYDRIGGHYAVRDKIIEDYSLGIVMLDNSIGVSPLYALMFPLAIIVYIFIGIDSTVRGSLGFGFSWKGRVYGKPIERQLEPSPV